MAERHYTIRRVFLIVIGLNAFLLLCLFLISLLQKGTSMEKFILLLFFLPALLLFGECLFRRVAVSEGGLAIRRLGRNKTLLWDEITRVGYLVLRKKVYLLLTTVKGFFVISNAYEGFPRLVEQIVAHVEPDRVEQEAREQTGRSLQGVAHVVTAGVAALLMIGMILMKLLFGENG